MIGKKILNYKIESVLGEGGMGTVYLGIHSQLGRKVAIKMLHPNLSKHAQLRERFKNEASALANLQHPNIIALYDYYENEDGLFLIMEYVEGKELSDYISEVSGPMNDEEATFVFKQVLDAFDYAHSKGVVHRDIKPSNILITSDKTVKVMDFGIAKILDNQKSLTKTGTQMGTVYYMSPEQVKGEKVDQLSDIYSLGVTLFQMLTGQCPYKSDTTEFQIYNSIVKDPLPDPKSIYPAVSEQFCNVIEQATQKDKKNRFKSCKEFKTNLDEKPKASSQKAIKKEPKKEKKTTISSSSKLTGSINLKKVLIITGLCVVSIFLFKQFSNKNNETEMGSYDTAVLFLELNFREDPSSNSDHNIIASYPSGYEIKLLDDYQTYDDIVWYHVEIDGKQGWVAGEINYNQYIISKNDYKQFLRIMDGGKENIFNRKSTGWLKLAVFEKAYDKGFTKIQDIKKVNMEGNTSLNKPNFIIPAAYSDDVRNYCRFRSNFDNTENSRDYPPEYAVLVKSNDQYQEASILVFTHNPFYNSTTLEFEEKIYEDIIGFERLTRKKAKNKYIYIEGDYDEYIGAHEVLNPDFKFDACRIFFRYSENVSLLYRYDNYNLSIKNETSEEEYDHWMNYIEPSCGCAEACGDAEYY